MTDYHPAGPGGQKPDHTLLKVVLSMMFALAVLTYAILDNLIQFVFKNPIVLTGQILDNEGNPLDQVNVSVHSSRLSLFGSDFSKSSDYDRTVGHRFRMACKFCSHLGLRFSKQGYYGRRLSVSRGRADGTVRINDQEYDSGVDEPVESTLIMQKRGTPTDLLFGSAVIKTGDSGIETVLAFDKTERPGEVAADDIDLSGQTPFFFIFTAVRSNGDLLLKDTGEKYRPRSSPGQPVSLWHPVDIALVASGAGSGFKAPSMALYEDDFLTPIDKRRKMVEAPSDGYTNRLEIDAGQVDPLFFFFKVGSLYGVGAVYSPVLRRSQSGNVIQVPVMVAVNPDGSRNTAATYDETVFAPQIWPRTLPHR